MPKLVALLILLAIPTAFFAQEAVPMKKETVEMPSVADCIPESVSKLGPPANSPFQKGLVTAVSAATREAQIHTLQGLNHLHGGWEFEAMRHFAIAMEEDPRCLMAHWGMVMSMLSTSPETDACRLAASQRMLELINDGEGTDLERGYAYGLIKYIEEGPAGAAEAFRKVARRFPNEQQAEIFAALFGRTGYDELGSATPDQEKAEERLLKVIKSAPDDPRPLNALLQIRAEAPDLRPSLDLARKLCDLAPNYPPYFYVLGHYEWRSGEHAKAASTFAHAATLYSTWMKKNKATPADCSGWVRAECYRVVALSSRGDFQSALESAEKIAATPTDPARASAAGTRALIWYAQTLPAQVLLRRSLPGDSAKAFASLPSREKGAPFREKSLSYWWVDGLRIAIESQRLLDAGDLEKAIETIPALTLHGQAMVKRQAVASAIGERAEWLGSLRSLEALAAQLRGRLALAGPPAGHGSAFNWFRAAADRQTPTTMLAPPTILTPMAMSLGDYFIARNQPDKAIEAYEAALRSFPNDRKTEERMEKAQDLAEKLGEASNDETSPTSEN
jgi:tetratricopeptide (TPR) repeat protein